MSNAITTLEQRANRIDEIAQRYSTNIVSQGGGFTRALQTAQAMTELRALLTPDLMAPVMSLMNSPLGFLTDKDPNRPVWNKDKRMMVAPDPYPVEVVRDCVIEARLRGVELCGNQFNIIGGRTYITKEGFRNNLLKRLPGLTDLKVIPGVPKTVGENGAIVEMKATWKMNGTPDSLTLTIPIRVNNGMGADAILGKADRKMRAAIYGQITGSEITDGEAGEDAFEGAKPVEGRVVTSVVSPKYDSFSAPTPKTSAPAGEPEVVTERATPAEGLANLCKASGVTEDAVLALLKEQQACDPNAQTFEDVSEPHLQDLISNWEVFVQQLRGAQTATAATEEQTETTGTAAVSHANAIRKVATSVNITEEQVLGWLRAQKFAKKETVTLDDLTEHRLTWLHDTWETQAPKIQDWASAR